MKSYGINYSVDLQNRTYVKYLSKMDVFTHSLCSIMVRWESNDLAMLLLSTLPAAQRTLEVLYSIIFRTIVGIRLRVYTRLSMVSVGTNMMRMANLVLLNVYQTKADCELMR
jgi:hypothetical protein